VRGRLRVVLAAVVALLAVAGVVVGCAAAGATPGSPGATGVGHTDAPVPPAVTLSAAPGRTDVDPASEISVSAPDAELRDVALTGATGRAVAGATTPDGHHWVAGEPLGYGKSYTWSGTAVGADGATTPVAGTFG